MPLCVHCAYPAKHLYTTYKTKSNIRLAVCPRCDRFLDPLIEHDPLILLLDLVLLKPRVFLHLIFNRGAPPLDALAPEKVNMDDDRARYEQIRADGIRLAAMVICADALVRLTAYGSVQGLGGVMQVVLVVVAETVAQHVTTLALTLLALRWRGWYPSATVHKSQATYVDGRRGNFSPMLVPLTLLYTSLLPLILQLFLSIWHGSITPTEGMSLAEMLPFGLANNPEIKQVADSLTALWNRGDRVWAGTRLLGGMSAGFGLRVLLPTKPWETTAIVLAGWGAAGLAGWALHAVEA